MSQIENRQGTYNSLQISRMGTIPSGKDFEIGKCFLIKNVSGDELTATIVPCGQQTPVETILDAGWNPEIVSKVINAPEGLQWGY